MSAFLLRRLLQSAAVMAVVAFIAFGLFSFTGDPVAFMLGQDAVGVAILGWLPSFGRGDTVALGWWTTGLLSASGLKARVFVAINLAVSLLQYVVDPRLHVERTTGH